ncbi:MAG: hypothetical protein L7S62_07340, partial [Flavobacteriales bacterium]|nr:hypothetical protein [Flavobacteriales bacterium]
VAIVVGSAGMMMLHHFFGFVFPEAAMSQMPQDDPEALRAFMDSLGIGPKLSVVVSHWLGTAVGASYAMRFAPVSIEWLRTASVFKSTFPGWVMGVWFTIGGIVNAMMIPMPSWMLILDLVGYVPVAFWVSRGLVSQRKR